MLLLPFVYAAYAAVYIVLAPIYIPLLLLKLLFTRTGKKPRESKTSVSKGYQWMATHDERCCLKCLERDGTQSKTMRKPPHPGCRCCQVPVTKTWAELGITIPKGFPGLADLDNETLPAIPPYLIERRRIIESSTDPDQVAAQLDALGSQNEFHEWAFDNTKPIDEQQTPGRYWLESTLLVLPGVTPKNVSEFFERDLNSPYKVAHANPSLLTEIKGVGAKKAQRIISAAVDVVATWKTPWKRI